jgi:hypothetical protein
MNQIQQKRLWESVFGSGALTLEWWNLVTWIEGDEETPGIVELSIDNPYNDDTPTITKQVTINTLTDAYHAARRDGICDPCTGELPEYENLDACSADHILQLAVLDAVEYA